MLRYIITNKAELLVLLLFFQATNNIVGKKTLQNRIGIVIQCTQL